MNKPYGGWIELILGPMFSGKTTELMRRIRRLKVARKRCLIIKYHKDIRYSLEKACTHDGAEIDAVSANNLSEIETEDYDVIGIDEGQFFKDIVPFCDKQANIGKIVIVSALDGTFQRKPFGFILELIPMAERVTKLTAVCVRCGFEAAFSKRLGNETEVEVIGGSEKYEARCRKCYLETP
jgi:thymidine kinase